MVDQQHIRTNNHTNHILADRRTAHANLSSSPNKEFLLADLYFDEPFGGRLNSVCLLVLVCC